MGGSTQARRGIGLVMKSLTPTSPWREAAREYRKLLYVTGEARGTTETGQPTRPGFQPEQVEEVKERDGALPLNELLRCRVRYFTDGAVLGSRAFVEDAFRRHRGHFGLKRTSGARKMIGGGWVDLCTARRLRLDVITPVPAAG